MQVTFESIGGMGDVLNTLPLLRKFKSMIDYGICDKLDVYYPSMNELNILKNNPYANMNLMKDYYPRDEKQFNCITTSTLHYMFRETNQINIFNVGAINIVDYYTLQCGFQLPPNEKYLEYFPDDSTIFNEYEIPDKYVVLCPSYTWQSRSWKRENWEKLVQYCEENNIFVILTGQGVEYEEYGEDSSWDGGKTSEGVDLWVHNMGFHANIPLNYGLDLCNKTTLDDLWFLLNKAEVVVTCDTGTLHLAGTTDSNILYITSNIQPKHRIPFRNGAQDYKVFEIGNSDCEVFCASNIMYNKKYHGSFISCPRISECLEGFDTFKCKSDPEDVYNLLSKIFNSGTVKVKEIKDKISVEDDSLVTYWFNHKITNIKDSRIADESKIWVQFWEDMHSDVNIIFTDLGQNITEFQVDLKIEKAGIWWFDLPAIFKKYTRLEILISKNNDIIYRKVIG